MDTLEGGEGAGLVATIDGARAGLLTWFVAERGAVPDVAGAVGAEGPGAEAEGAEAEVRALGVAPDARGRGVGRALVLAAAGALRSKGVRRAWVITTNDNLAALALYQKTGWRLAALRPGVVDELRRTVKPSIPATGEHGIPIRDELELEVDLKLDL